ncbi:hypothetical protein FAF44_02880 [Nonomuraea sp. MG754425]|uniref:hypothetical protein n=1 Tax=Nonomuraea sp. MG754425 TaxID=2570319 RepID=UPI001F2E78D2|nr:hypothetical protein [Nonomuraea sp. MG754425]MCF6467359.1 hypothetical protein [Nonomuraea sp. MG754425]
MPWVRVDDQFPVNRKVRPLSDRAFRLYVSALCWCNANLTDGVIGARELMYVSDVSSPRRYADELVNAGLWSKTNDGWQIHDYLEYQHSAIKVREGREAKKARQERWLESQRQTREAQQDASQGASQDVSGDDPPSHPTPIPSQQTFSNHSSDGPYAGDQGRTDGQDFLIVDEMIRSELAALTPHPITPEHAAHVRQLILSRARTLVKNPHRYIQRALRRDPHAYLPEQPAGYRGVGRMCGKHPFMAEPCRACAADRIAKP